MLASSPKCILSETDAPALFLLLLLVLLVPCALLLLLLLLDKDPRRDAVITMFPSPWVFTVGAAGIGIGAGVGGVGGGIGI